MFFDNLKLTINIKATLFQQPTVMAFSHVDIMQCIATKLDVATLCRFRCVSKDALIASRAAKMRTPLAVKRANAWFQLVRDIDVTMSSDPTKHALSRYENTKIYSWGVKVTIDDYKLFIKRQWRGEGFPSIDRTYCASLEIQMKSKPKILFSAESADLEEILAQIEYGFPALLPRCRKPQKHQIYKVFETHTLPEKITFSTWVSIPNANSDHRYNGSSVNGAAKAMLQLTDSVLSNIRRAKITLA